MGFKIGDKVKYIDSTAKCDYVNYKDWIGTIYEVSRNAGCKWNVEFAPAVKRAVCESEIVLAEENNKGTNMANIKEKFLLALTPEPQKSFRKAGITNGDDMLTEDGSKIFLSWLLQSKYQDEFKKDVVDGLLEDECDDKK